jgi:hypothetical protein
MKSSKYRSFWSVFDVVFPSATHAPSIERVHFSMEPNPLIHSSRAQYFRSNFLFCSSSEIDELLLVLQVSVD